MLGLIPWILLGLPSVSATAKFIKPGPPPYPKWDLGETQTIRYETTYKEYTIALWQQLQGAGKLGPILYETTDGQDNTEFEWVVQNYKLDLDVSDEFFLWLFEGPADRQGNTSYKNQQSSGKFTIVDDGTTTMESTASSSVPTSTIELSSSISSETETSTTEVSTTATTTTTSTAETTSSEAQNSESDGDRGELSVGAQAGIGVGAGIAALAIIAAIFFFFKYRSNKKRLEALEKTEPTYDHSSPPSYPQSTSPLTDDPQSNDAAYSQMSKSPVPYAPQQYEPQQPPAELGGESRQTPAELAGQPRQAPVELA